MTAVILAGCLNQAAARPLSPYRYELKRSGIVRTIQLSGWISPAACTTSKKQKRYAQGTTGSFVCRSEANSNGYRRSLLGIR